MDDLLADFLTEANESLAELDVALVRLEQAPGDQATLSLIFRLVHTIKGTCGFLGLPRLERVAHAAENVLGQVRDGALAVTPGLISVVLESLDRIKAIVAGIAATGAEPAGDDPALIARLNRAEMGADGGGAGPAPAQEPSEPAADAAVEAHPGTQTIRVNVDVLEDLMTLVSELVLTRNQLLQLSRKQAGVPGGNQHESFAAPLQRLSHITSDLQEGVMKTRMQPIGNAWNKLPRLVRDLAQDLGKKIELVMHGADTELDRQVLELIRDPLTHMVRNSADHGLEDPSTRRTAGKPDTGRITLTAYHEGGHILIEVSDDGRGLAVEKIRAKILANGLATEAELAGMSATEIQRFIFRAGFSTAAAVTAVSGRGVGMDVVKSNIERIGGTIELRSEAGRGSTFAIKIPLTLAIVSALIVEAGGERFAIPQLSVVELVRTQEARPGDASASDQPSIERLDGTPVLRLRNRLLPLVNLARLLELEADQAERGDSYIVVVQVGGSSFGVIVERVFDTEEIVVKPVAPALRAITMFSGNTILGDGSVIMILDPNGIARSSGIGLSAGDGREHPEAAGSTRATHSAATVSVLLFRAGGQEPKAVPLDLVARLEDIPRERIESAGGNLLVQYRGNLMPLVTLPGTALAPVSQKLMVFTDRGRSMGLMVDDIIDVVEAALRIELGSDRPGLLGTAVIAGSATDVLDVGYWLGQAHADWFQAGATAAGAAGRRLLVVEDSDFFRQLAVPALSAAGYRVTAVPCAEEALRLRESGAEFDAIISDIEMPDMDGLEFAQQVRAEGTWQRLPLIALSASAEPRRIDAARASGFTDYVAKFAREDLLASLRQCLAREVAAA